MDFEKAASLRLNEAGHSDCMSFRDLPQGGVKGFEWLQRILTGARKSITMPALHATIME